MNQKRPLYPLRLLKLALLFGLMGVAVKGHAAGAGHVDPFSDILFTLAVVIVVAVIGRWAATALNQASVLGELLMGVLIGNLLYWMGGPVAYLVMHLSSAGEVFGAVWNSGLSVSEAAGEVFTAEELEPGATGDRILGLLSGSEGARLVIIVAALWIFSNLGVILLLFMVGLESRVEEMAQVGPSAIAVALLGVAIPFGLGYVASAFLLTEQPVALHLFIGATLVATSVGITARVLKDLGAIHSAEAKLILGAAVIDDVLGLIVLAVVTGIVVTGAVQVGEIVKISLLSGAFFTALIFGGSRYMPRLASVFRRLEARSLTLLLPLILAFVVAWVANLIGLATIIGAFAAGLIVNEEHFSDADTERGSPLAILAPLEALFAPVFFVLVGMQVNLQSFLDSRTLWLACGFTVAALIGKLAAGWGAKPGVDKLSVGIGMIPRGEVGLIFATIGKGLGVVNDAVFSALVVMVIFTTLVAPLGLKWSLARRAGSGQS